MYQQFNAQTLLFLYTLYVFRVLTVRLLLYGYCQAIGSYGTLQMRH